MTRLILAMAAFLFISVSAAAQTTYSGSTTTGPTPDYSESTTGIPFTASFSLTTFNTIGARQVITEADIASWQVTVSGDGFTETFSNVTPDALLTIYESDLTADANGLYFDYSGTGLLDFTRDGAGKGELTYCTRNCGPTPALFIFANDVVEYSVMPDGVAQIGTAAAAAPEPAAWALMIGGFGVIGAAVRRRRGKRLAAA